MYFLGFEHLPMCFLGFNTQFKGEDTLLPDLPMCFGLKSSFTENVTLLPDLPDCFSGFGSSPKVNITLLPDLQMSLGFRKPDQKRMYPPTRPADDSLGVENQSTTDSSRVD
jgi:hypothetical protein